MTRKDYNVEHLIGVLKAFRERHPNLGIIMEPGVHLLGRPGFLVSSVVDIVENHGIKNRNFGCFIYVSHA